MAIVSDFKAQRTLDDKVDMIRNLYPSTTISKLPAEIMTEIFLLACTANMDTLIPTRSAIMDVCTRWKEIAEHTPRLWSLISLQEPSLVTESLERSKRRPLSIDFRKLRSPLLLSLVRPIIRETYRFRELHVRWPRNSMTLFVQVFFPSDRSLCAPLMETLEVDITWVPHCGMDPKTILPFWTGLTSLRSMTLNNILPVTITPTPSLTHVKIDIEDEGNHLSMTWALEFLRNAPMLESVSITTISSNHPLADPIDGMHPISLPCLHHLQLWFKYLTEVALLQYLDQIPMTIDVLIEFGNEGERNQGDFSRLRSFVASRFPEEISPTLDVKSYDAVPEYEDSRIVIVERTHRVQALTTTMPNPFNSVFP